MLRKIGCPEKLVKIIQSFYHSMQGQVIDGGEVSGLFNIASGTKQGCVLAPLLFCIFFSLMPLVTFQNCDIGIPVEFRTDRSVFNLRRLQAHTRTFAALVRDLYADDSVLMAHTQAEAQDLFNRFCDAAIHFGLTISLKKTEVLLQPVDRLTSTPPVVMAGETALPVVQRFCYLGSMISSDANIDEDISSSIAKASYSFGRLTRRLWDDHGI